MSQKPRDRMIGDMAPRHLIVALALVAALTVTAPAQAASPPCPPTPAPPAGPAAPDPLRAHQWGLDQIHAPEAWAIGAKGKGVVVAVVDSGVDLDHPDLAS